MSNTKSKIASEMTKMERKKIVCIYENHFLPMCTNGKGVNT